MLYPQTNPYRQLTPLSDFWDFRFDPNNNGIRDNWINGFPDSRPIAVPASWNDQFEDGRDNLGPAWYQTTFDLPWSWQGQRIMLRFGSVNYLADVWLNGVKLGQHEGGHLPFEFDITPHVTPTNNRLVVRVDGLLAPDRVPPGEVPYDPLDRFANTAYPDATFDFFPFCGIQRPVLLYTVPPHGIADITVETDIADSNGIVHVTVQSSIAPRTRLEATLVSGTEQITASIAVTDVSTKLTLDVPNAAFWSPDSPTLYDLTVTLYHSDTAYDRYTLPIGIRTIRVEGDQLLLNGKPITLKGFGRHEDFPIAGRGYVPAVIIKDYALMHWVGANSFRTTHYPYSEQMLDLADRLGFLVIAETPAVGLFFREEGLDRRLALCRQFTQELIARDKNHPSVIMWSLANEPHSKRPAAGAFFRNLYDLAKSLDTSRPVTLVSMIENDVAFDFYDVICLNRYIGWYWMHGRLEESMRMLSTELDEMYAKYHKPIILSEFGADALAGMHSQPPEMFTEEYQAEMLTRYIELLNTKPYVVGQHVWNLCDFKTGQAVHRIGGLNMKGVFTRDRRPKLAAHRLRTLWHNAP